MPADNVRNLDNKVCAKTISRVHKLEGEMLGGLQAALTSTGRQQQVVRNVKLRGSLWCALLRLR